MLRGKLVFGAALLCGGAARAAEDGVDIERFHPSNDAYGYFSVPSAATLQNLQLGVGLWANYEDDPLVLADDAGRVAPVPENADGNNGDGLVDSRLMGHFQVGMGITRYGSLVVDAPIALFQNGYQAGQLGNPTVSPTALKGGLGDIRISPKFVAMDRDRSPVGIAVLLPIGIPSGDGSIYNGEGGVTVIPTVVAEVSDGSIHQRDYKIRAALDLGYKVRPTDRIRDVGFSSEALYGVGLGYHPVDPLEVNLEIQGGVFGPSQSQHAAEAMLGLKALIGNWVNFNVGGGLGLLPGVGTPDYRIVAGLVVAPSFDPNARDADHDGVPDGQDRCKDQAEDHDGFQDDDGCPEDDNDVDGVPDAQDQCPDDPEDDDGWMDNDGCPDNDNDKDGIPDASDRCPNEAETVNDFQDDDGCPDDKPINDTDGDGYMDDIDRCPYDAEDIDGFQDADGCPDPDNDNDGIPDTEDRCPDVREVMNGVDDDDGCPDEGRVVVEKESIRINDVIYFDFGKASIQPRSYSLLDEIGAVVKDHTELRKIRIEGHTDSVGDDISNLKLSQARADAVKAALIQRGIEANRLDAAGFGEMRPIASNDDEEGRSKNRRVEFIIVERD